MLVFLSCVGDWLTQVSDLLSKFQFVPAWRVDDVMVSYAPKGGSVGPHVDNYDVFLLQVRKGARRHLVVHHRKRKWEGTCVCSIYCPKYRCSSFAYCGLHPYALVFGSLEKSSWRVVLHHPATPPHRRGFRSQREHRIVVATTAGPFGTSTIRYLLFLVSHTMLRVAFLEAPPPTRRLGDGKKKTPP